MCRRGIAGLRKLPHGVGTKSQACESFPTAWARNRKLRKLPHVVGTKSQVAKASPRCGHEIAGLRKLPHGVGTKSQACESFPTAWARNRKLRKLPHGVGTKSQAAKICCLVLPFLDFLQVFGRGNAEFFFKALPEVDCAVDAYFECDFRNVVFPFQ